MRVQVPFESAPAWRRKTLKLGSGKIKTVPLRAGRSRTQSDENRHFCRFSRIFFDRRIFSLRPVSELPPLGDWNGSGSMCDVELKIVKNEK